ncbi:MAG: tRNA (N(6)-L-threonylcarbamoyladenosine(37)-C(2))-methylthiotransferase MtaB [Bacteroidales bacterium]|nr:tRNA (N(6)-L-threonylcarbamoyladenosine(37)-C(2))-methylthiotransferase MtaB [Bacteroidales bacterium]
MALKKVAFHTLGCKLNYAETSTMARNFEAHGYERVDFNQQADVYVINSCSVTARADKKSEEALKKARNQNPQARVVMVGCYAQLQPEKIARIRGIDLILGSNEKFRILDYLQEEKKLQLQEQEEKKKEPEIHTCTPDQTRDYFPSFSYGDRTRSFLKVQDGCDYHCSYCTIPLARGKSRNQPVSGIVQEARVLGESGIKEIILTGVNIGDFGKSTGESFIGLIKALEQVPGIERYRISSIEPNLLTEEIIDFVARSNKFLPHFHIPLQSGNDHILGKMRRRYRRGLFREKVEAVRTRLPDAFIGVDLIVGFPGEDEQRFHQTLEFLKEMDVGYYHAFSFSARPNTPAYNMQPKVPNTVIKQRSHMVQELAEQKKLSFYRRHLGQTREVLFEGSGKDELMAGFTDNYIRVEVPFHESLPGTIHRVYLQEITEGGTVKGLLSQ